MGLLLSPEFVPANGTQTLVVLLHGVNAGPDRLEAIRQTITNERDKLANECDNVANDLGNVDIFAPAMPLGAFSFANLNSLAWEILSKIDRAWFDRMRCADGQPYTCIILVGHSLGALIARKIYVYACGENSNAPFEEADIPSGAREPKSWAPKVERIILMAGMNRGWTISHHLAIPKALMFRLGIFAGQIMQLFRKQKYLYFQFRRGAPFITQLRIQWLAMRRNCVKQNQGIGTALTVQLLGSIDDVVAPDDNIDLVTGSAFFYLNVPKSGHGNVVDMGKDPDKPNPRNRAEREELEIRQGRQKSFLQAIRCSGDELKEIQVDVIDQDLRLPPINKDITDVIFVIHGIRDLGYWTHKIAQKVTKLGAAPETKKLFATETSLDAEAKPKKRLFATETSSYGYFPMLPFILPWTRRAKVEWLMDQYITDLTLYPNADFSFVGHSNGTYLLAKALEEYPACHFKHVVFAGSVVRSGYDWEKLLPQYDVENVLVTPGRVTAVMNYVATADWVVALFPKGLQTLHIPDLGSAGHDGFTRLDDHQEIRYVKGGHSAAIQEDLWDAIATFIVSGKIHQPTRPLTDKQRLEIVVGGLASPLIWLLLFGLVFGGGAAVWQITSPESLKSGALLLYIAFVWSVVTRV
jgi:pimeloyl-ACP methyl ester carboxylesterase